MKRFLFFLLVLLLSIPSLASAQTNQVTLTSYYPSPFGAYDRLRLVPRDSLGDDCLENEEGVLYLPNTGSTIYQCSNLNWTPLSGGTWKMTAKGKIDTEHPNVLVDQYVPVKDYPNPNVKMPYVGIGTADPLRPLHIFGNSTLGVPLTLLALENPAQADGVGTAISFRGTTRVEGNIPFSEMAAISATYIISTANKQQANMILSITNFQGFKLNILTLNGDNGGRVSINSSLPRSSTFDIATPLPGSGDSYFTISPNATIAGDSGKVFVVTSPMSGGKVGINKQSPTEQLEVGGNIKATTLILTSDAALKKDIAPVTGALDKISRLKGVTFEWKDPAVDTKTHMGVLAQDVEKVFPGVVSGKEGAKGVDYPSLIAPLIEAVKELKNQNEVLSQQILSQQEQIKSLQRSLEHKEPTLSPQE